MSLQRRLTLYLIGLILGGMMAYKFYGDQQLAQWSTDLNAVRLSLDSASLDLGASKRTPDSIFYSMRTIVAGRNADLTIAVLRDFDLDTTATLQRIVLVQ